MKDDGEVVYFNEASEYLCRELLLLPLRRGEKIAEFRQRSSQGRITEILHNIGVEGRSVKSFSNISNKQGTKLFLEMEFIPLPSRQGNRKVLMILTDNTAQKVFENKLINQSDYIADLFHKANAVIFGIDMRGYITDWNDHASEVTGFDKNDVYAQKAESVLFENDTSEQFKRYVDKVLTIPQAGNIEVPVRAKERSSPMLLLSGTPRISTGGSAIGVTFVGQDVTELTEYRKSLETKVEERTRELQRALTKEQEAVEIKARFVSIASHEFRTPLSSIQFASETLRKDFKDISFDQVTKKLDEIEKQVSHMKVLLDDVLTYGKNDQAKIKLILSHVPVQEFFLKVCEDVRRSQGLTHRIETKIEDAGQSWQTDEKMMRSILTNLIANAIKFSPGRDCVYLNVKGESGYLMISVRDEGIGIPEEERERIFEPFTRGQRVTGISGSGLGLSIVKKSVELLHGKIELRSQPGAGSVFTVKIPFEPQFL